MKDYKRTEIVETSDVVLSKSNLLIAGKYRATLNEQRVMFVALLKLQDAQFHQDKETKELIVAFPTAELMRLLNCRSGSLYKNLDSIAQNLVSTSIGVSDPITKRFEYMSLITDCKYEDGMLYVAFNSRIQDKINSLKLGYTNLNRRIMVSFRSTYTFRLYEILKQRAYYPKNYAGRHTGLFSATFDKYELMLLLGVVNANLDAVRRVLSNSAPDYKKACEASPEKMYERFSHFKTRVLDTAVNEINTCELSDIHVEYRLLKKARGEVYAIEFLIRTDEYQEEIAPSENTITDIPMRLHKGQLENALQDTDKFLILAEVVQLFSDYDLRVDHAVSICEAADYDIVEVRKVATLLRMQTNKIRNPMGWILEALKRGYELPDSEKKDASSPKQVNAPTEDEAHTSPYRKSRPGEVVRPSYATAKDMPNTCAPFDFEYINRKLLEY